MGTSLLIERSRDNVLFAFVCSYCGLNLLVLFYADLQYNKAVPSGLIVEERMRGILEIPVGEWDWRVVL